MKDPCSGCSQEQTLEREQTPPPDQTPPKFIHLIPRVAPRTQQIPGSPSNVNFPEMPEVLSHPPRVPSPSPTQQEGQLSNRDDERAKFDFNVVARLSQWMDENLCLIRNISTGMAVVGLILLAKSIKLTNKFISSSDIPEEFIKKNVKLRGRLRRITENGLNVEHTPITVPLISRWRSK
ncbi:protein C3orf33 homolog isoform X2 [Gracilinanus agilis]|uniref:protein C3orf33 homolog isoform X2 n=1 Tax=Gracilinanus agilis TaxID=191870 RepID=UPI001CFDFA17|nr:protein C3orf33 homolog isoform X2 [Gracilinanus agilis]